LVACSSESETPPYPDEQSFCTAKAKEECQVAAKCAAREDTCRSLRQGACERSGIDARANGVRKFKAENAKACVDKTHEVYAKDTILPTDIAALDDACGKVWRGDVAKFQPCNLSYDCSDGLICDKGRCGEPVQRATGQPCGNPGETCEASAFCTLKNGVYQCEAKKAKGETCSASTAPCGPTLRCNNSCIDRFGSGEPCDTNDDCAASAPYCDAYAGRKCSAGLRYGPGYGGCTLFGGS
jgi:hypothetical protein